MMGEGLIYSFRGQIGVAVFFLIVGVFLCVAAMAVVFVRKGPPLTTQTDHLTGVKSHGIGWWFLLLAMITMGPAALFIFVRTLVEAGDVALGWVVAHQSLAAMWAVVALSAGVAVRVLRRQWRDRTLGFLPATEPDPTPEPVVPAPVEPAVGWSLPPDEPHWSAER